MPQTHAILCGGRLNFLSVTNPYFNPPPDRVRMLQWARFDDIVKQDYVHGQSELQDLSDRV